MHYLSPEFGLLFVAFLWIYWWIGSAYNNQWQNGLLLIASYLFYASFNWRFALQLFVFSLVILGLAKLAARNKEDDEDAISWPVVIGVCLALINLGIFKYYHFFREDVLPWIQPWFQNASMPLLSLILPVGISFYTFQGLAYLISVGRGECKPAGLINGLLHLSFFPTLLAGPICRPSELLTQIESPQPRSVMASEWAILLIISALIKKIWLASWLANTWVNPLFANPDNYHAVELFCGLMAYAWQLFFDFSGYTDTVTALALLMGFHLPINFRQPYLATSISHFWQRWHITLSRWIRDYVYIPLGGNRGSWGRTQVNAVLAMVLSGLWHGASITFMLWGLWHGLGLVFQNIWKKCVGVALPGFLTQALTFIFVCFGWLLFRAEDWQSITEYASGFSRWDQIPTTNWLGILAIIIFFFTIARYVEPIMSQSAALLGRLPGWGQGVALMLVAMIILQLAPPGMPGFIYFGF